ncbi:MAG: diaminopimelate epimerase [Haloplasmataceae bacterium]|nr:diaminopimelate epimerase [Haloplasmataceae bacterium]
MIYFEKLHGTGNDFIIFNSTINELKDLSHLAMKVCDRHFGIGADGMMVAFNSQVADIRMIYYNSDGSEAPMCGNGIRCFAKYVFDNKIVTKENFNVETLGGIMKVELFIQNDEVYKVRINMGKPEFNTHAFPINSNLEKILEEKIQVEEYIFKISVLNMGTIHSVIFVDSLETIDIPRAGVAIEHHKLFPKKTNVNFCQVIDKENIKVVTWERGAGLTLACGTGSAATAVVSSLIKNTNKKVNVLVPGGTLEIEQINDEVFLTGNAVRICTGNYQI